MTPSIQEILKQLREAEAAVPKGEWVDLPKSIHLIVLMRNNLIPLLDYVEELERNREDWKNGKPYWNARLS